MKSEKTLIGLLVCTALLLAAFLAFHTTQTNYTRADVLDSGSDISLLTSSMGYTNDAMLNVLDSRDGLMLSYLPNGNQLKLVGAYDMNRLMSVPSLR